MSESPNSMIIDNAKCLLPAIMEYMDPCTRAVCSDALGQSRKVYTIEEIMVYFKSLVLPTDELIAQITEELLHQNYYIELINSCHLLLKNINMLIKHNNEHDKHKCWNHINILNNIKIANLPNIVTEILIILAHLVPNELRYITNIDYKTTSDQVYIKIIMPHASKTLLSKYTKPMEWHSRYTNNSYIGSFPMIMQYNISNFKSDGYLNTVNMRTAVPVRIGVPTTINLGIREFMYHKQISDNTS